MISKNNSSGSPHTGQKVTIKPNPEEIPNPPSSNDDDIQAISSNAETIVNSLESDTHRMSSWVTNAKIALDVAQRSLEEAGKLAESIHQKSSDATETVKPKTDVELEGTSIAENSDSIVAAGGVDKLQYRAKVVLSLVNESSDQIREIRHNLMAKTKLLAYGMEDQVANLSNHMEITAHVLEEEHSHNKNSACAEDILKGKAPYPLDPKSLDKIDGVISATRADSMDTNAAQASPSVFSNSGSIASLSMFDSERSANRLDSMDTNATQVAHPAVSRGDSTKPGDPVPKETKYAAEDVLKTHGMVPPDPASMDKIDGLPTRVTS